MSVFLIFRKHYTDTGGATEHVFGLCHLLGFRFAPRLRDLSECRLYVVDRRADHGALDCCYYPKPGECPYLEQKSR